MDRDPLRIVEAAYRAELDTQAFLDGVVDAARPFDTGGGIIAYILRFEGEAPRLLGMSAGRGPEGSELMTVYARSATVALSSLGHLLRAVHQPAPRIQTSYGDLPRLVRRAGGNMAELTAVLPALIPPSEIALAGDSRTTLSLHFHSPARGTRLAARDRRLLRMIITHLGAGIRLRSTPPDEASVEAWLEPSGRLLDARGAAASELGRKALTAAVQQVDRARGALRRTSPEEALGLWRGLVRAEWSIVETVERDGKRLVLARRNRPEAPEHSGLTANERVVAFLAASGHSHKGMAYELGVGISSVAHLLRSALVKLGVRSRVELARLYGPPAGVTKP